MVVALLFYSMTAATARKHALFWCRFSTVTTDSGWPLSVPDGTVYLLCLVFRKSGASPRCAVSLHLSFDVNRFTYVFVYLR